MMSGIPLMAESDTMSGVEPLGTISESSAGASPSQEERQVSARSSANTAELLASTLLPLSQISDPEDSPQFTTSRPVGNQTSHELVHKKDDSNPIWKDEEGQTVSTIFSPLSEKPLFDTKSKSDTNNRFKEHGTEDDSSAPGSLAHHPPTDQYVARDHHPEVGSILHSSLLTPRKLEKFQQNSQKSRSITTKAKSHGAMDPQADGANTTLLGRRTDFVSSFNQRESQGQEKANRVGVKGHSWSEEEARMGFADLPPKDLPDQSLLKDYEEQRLSADSTLTEHLLRGITPVEDTSPYSLPFDSGLASNLQSLQVGMQSHRSVSFQSEGYLLQEALEKERYRRKHCELQIKELQSKLLESQQLLAVAEATRKKKDFMIAQVEKNFSKIMSDWKTKDQEKLEALDCLKKNCEKHEHISKMREQELEVREKEKKDLRLSQEALRAELNQIKDESSSHVEGLKQQMALSMQQMEHAVEERVAAEQHVKKIQDMLAKERSQWREKEVALTKNLARVEEEFDLKDKEFKRTLEAETEAAKKVAAESKSNREKVSHLQDQLSKILQEKESLSLELNLKQSQYEASLQKQEMDWKEQLERLIQERMDLLHEETSHQLEKQREAHHRQIAEMAERQQEELKKLREENSIEMKNKDARYQSSIEQFQSKLDLSHQEVLKLSTKLEQAQKHRSFIITKLQSCLQSYTNDSLKMLGQLDSSPSTSMANNFKATDTSSFTKRSSQETSDRSPLHLQNVRTSVEQPLLQLMASLSSDGGYQTLSASSDRRGGAPPGVEGRDVTSDQESLSFTGRSSIPSHPMESEVYSQPLPMRYGATSVGWQPNVGYGSLPSNQEPLDVRYNLQSSDAHYPDVRYSSTGVLPPLSGSHIARQMDRPTTSLPTSENHQRHHLVPPLGFSSQTKGSLVTSPSSLRETSILAGDTSNQASKLFHYERPENDTTEKFMPLARGMEVSTVTEDEERQDQFAPVPESEESISKHPLDSTNKSLGEITRGLGKEEDRRQVLQHYLKELLNQTSLPEQLRSENNQLSESTHLEARDTHKTRFSARASMVSSAMSQASGVGYHRQLVSRSEQPPRLDVETMSAVPSNSPVQKDIIPVKERILTSAKPGQRSTDESKSGRRSADGSRSGRSSANSSVHQGRGQTSRDQQSSFGTSTPKKKGNQPVKPPTRKTKPGKTKHGVWR